MDLLMVENKELGCRVQQLRATKSALEAANAAMNGFLVSARVRVGVCYVFRLCICCACVFYVMSVCFAYVCVIVCTA